jgi:hypothetical protein
VARAPKVYAAVFGFPDFPEEGTPSSALQSGIVVLDDSTTALRDHEEHEEHEHQNDVEAAEHEQAEDGEFMTVTLEEVELLDPPIWRTDRRRDPRRVVTRALERRDRSRRVPDPTLDAIDTSLPEGGDIAARMAALLLVVAIVIAASLAAQ